VSSSRRPARKPSRTPARASKAASKRASAKRGAAKAPAKRATAKAPALGAAAKAPARRVSAGTTAKRAPKVAQVAPARLKKAPAPVFEPPPSRPPTPAPRPGIRLAGSASSRLTIKPGPPRGPSPKLELSTKVRPGGPRPLSEVELDEDEVLIDAFDASLGGTRVRITAVLERTCVYIDRGGERRLASKKDLVVEADKLPIRRRGIG
jgi:hypothetical protein